MKRTQNLKIRTSYLHNSNQCGTAWCGATTKTQGGLKMSIKNLNFVRSTYGHIGKSALYYKRVFLNMGGERLC